MTGYHAAIWDRTPEHWKNATLHCRCKERYVNNVYKDMMIYVRKKCVENGYYEKKYVDKMKKTYLKESFANSNKPFVWAFIWKDSPEGLTYWESVNTWVNYFNSITK